MTHYRQPASSIINGKDSDPKPNPHNPKTNEECLIGNFLLLTSKYIGMKRMKLTFSDKNKHSIVLPQHFRTSEVGATCIDDVQSYDRPREVPALV